MWQFTVVAGWLIWGTSMGLGFFRVTSVGRLKLTSFSSFTVEQLFRLVTALDRCEKGTFSTGLD